MRFLKDDLGNDSLMRKVVWIMTIATVVWMGVELVANVILTAMGLDYEVHTSYILTMVAIVLGGKVSQKAVELFQKPNKE
jgi:hypothetical protein